MPPRMILSPGQKVPPRNFGASSDEIGIFGRKLPPAAAAPQQKRPPTASTAVPSRSRSQEDATPSIPAQGTATQCACCARTIRRFYHCVDCPPSQPFDICTPCCASLYLPPDRLPPGMDPPRLTHPAHDMSTHRMVQIVPPGDPLTSM
jgi:hypothetical protein